MIPLLQEYKEGIRYRPYRELLRDLRYTSSNLGLAYRVISHWADIGLIDNKRSSDTRWRKYSIIDIVWVAVIVELRKYGFSLEKIFTSKGMLFKDGVFEFFLFMVLCSNPVTILFFSDGSTTFLLTEKQSTPKYIREGILDKINRTSFVYVDLNRLVKTSFPQERLSTHFDEFKGMNNDEFELVNFIRFNSYDEVRVKFTNGQIDRFEGVKRERTEKKIIDIIKEHDYQNIDICVAEGNVVSVEKTIKQKLDKHGNKPA